MAESPGTEKRIMATLFQMIYHIRQAKSVLCEIIITIADGIAALLCSKSYVKHFISISLLHSVKISLR